MSNWTFPPVTCGLPSLSSSTEPSPSPEVSSPSSYRRLWAGNSRRPSGTGRISGRKEENRRKKPREGPGCKYFDLFSVTFLKFNIFTMIIVILNIKCYHKWLRFNSFSSYTYIRYDCETVMIRNFIRSEQFRRNLQSFIVWVSFRGIVISVPFPVLVKLELQPKTDGCVMKLD